MIEESSPEVKDLNAKLTRLEDEMQVMRELLMHGGFALADSAKNEALAARRREEGIRKEQDELARNSNLSLKLNWTGLVEELKMLNGPEECGPSGIPKDVMLIDMVNKMRVGAFREIHQDSDEMVIVKAKAYETFYRVCVAELESRAVRIKIEKRNEFEQVKQEQKAARITAEKNKEDRRRRTPEEQMLDAMVALGMTKEMAVAQMQTLRSKGKELRG